MILQYIYNTGIQYFVWVLQHTLLSSTNVFSQLSHHLSGGIARIAKPCYASAETLNP